MDDETPPVMDTAPTTPPPTTVDDQLKAHPEHEEVTAPLTSSCGGGGECDIAELSSEKPSPGCEAAPTTTSPDEAAAHDKNIDGSDNKSVHEDEPASHHRHHHGAVEPTATATPRLVAPLVADSAAVVHHVVEHGVGAEEAIPISSDSPVKKEVKQKKGFHSTSLHPSPEIIPPPPAATLSHTNRPHNDNKRESAPPPGVAGVKEELLPPADYQDVQHHSTEPNITSSLPPPPPATGLGGDNASANPLLNTSGKERPPTAGGGRAKGGIVPRTTQPHQPAMGQSSTPGGDGGSSTTHHQHSKPIRVLKQRPTSACSVDSLQAFSSQPQQLTNHHQHLESDDSKNGGAGGGLSPVHRSTPLLAYRVGSAASRKSNNSPVVPSTRAATPASYFIPPVSVPSMPLTEVVDLPSLIAGSGYGVGSSGAWLEEQVQRGKPETEMSSELKLLLVEANAHCCDLADLLRFVARNDSARNREIVRMLNAFLCSMEHAVDRTTDSSSGTAASGSGSGSKLKKSIPRSSLRNEETTRRLASFFGPPTIVQVVPLHHDMQLDVARVSQDGTNRLTLQRVPMSVPLILERIEEKKKKVEQCKAEVQRCLQQQQQQHADQPAQSSTQQLQETATGSPVHAIIRQSKHVEDHTSSPPRQGGQASGSASAKELHIVTCAYQEASMDLVIEQEHRALVQCLWDANVRAPAVAAAAPHKTPQQGEYQSAGGRSNSATTAPATKPKKSGTQCEATLSSIADELSKHISDVDKSLRQLRNTPSQSAVSKDTKQSRLVTVDKEDLLLRDREQLRASLTVVERCVDELNMYRKLVDEERRAICSSAVSLKSTAASRDDELAIKNYNYWQLHQRMVIVDAENQELKGMLKSLLDHVEHLKLRIEASRRAPPVQPHHMASMVLSSSRGQSPTNGGGGGCSRRSSPIASLNATATSRELMTYSARDKDSSNHNSNLRDAYNGSPVLTSTHSPSRDIFRTLPDLSLPHRLSPSQQLDLSKRLHDNAMDLQKRIAQSVKSTKRRSPSPPLCCSRPHSVPLYTGEREDVQPLSLDEFNERFYTSQKDHRQKTLDRLAKKVAVGSSLPSSTKKFTSPQDEAQAVDKLYVSSIQHRTAMWQKLFHELVLSKEEPYSPKKVSRDELSKIVDRLSSKDS